jgi:hypothetical protein
MNILFVLIFHLLPIGYLYFFLKKETFKSGYSQVNAFCSAFLLQTVLMLGIAYICLELFEIKNEYFTDVLYVVFMYSLPVNVILFFIWLINALFWAYFHLKNKA